MSITDLVPLMRETIAREMKLRQEAEAERDAMRPVVEAARALRAEWDNDAFDVLCEAVDALDAKRGDHG